jgi:hypothetical protein
MFWPTPAPTTHWQGTYTRLEERGVGDIPLLNTIMVIKNMTTTFTIFVFCLTIYKKTNKLITF